MREVEETIISKIVGRIYRDTTVHQTTEYFIKHVYKAEQFKNMIDEDSFHRILGFLPNTKYRGTPFIMSVAYNKRLKEYEVLVHNPKIKY